MKLHRMRSVSPMMVYDYGGGDMTTPTMTMTMTMTTTTTMAMTATTISRFVCSPPIPIYKQCSR